MSLFTSPQEEHTFRSTQLPAVIGEAVDFFANTPLSPLPPPFRFLGPGVYALYYLGDFDLYSLLSAANRQECKWPIYVGKAVPPGWRTGREALSETATLYSRLREHSVSIERANNLVGDHFVCRYMFLADAESDLIGTVEAALIRTYQPIWNTIIDGFGNHDPGNGRYNQSPSEWDVLHPGRSWVKNLKGEPPDIQEIRNATLEELQRRFRSSTTAS